MKFIFVILILLISTQLLAQTKSVQSPVSVQRPAFVEPNLAVGRMPTSRHDLNNFGVQYATWYMKINLKELRQSGLLALLKDKEFKFSKYSAIQLTDKIPENLDRIYLYGNNLKRSGDITLLMNGRFNDSEIIDLIVNNLYTVDGVPQLKQTPMIYSRGHEIYVFELINDSSRHKKKYAARLVDGTFVFSNNLSEVRIMFKRWERAVKYLYHHKTVLEEENDLMVLNINTEIAQQNMDLNLENDDYVMQSQLFKKAKNIVATIHFEQLKLIINGALTTKEIETAEQIEKIINGVAAFNTLSDEKGSSLQSQLLENLSIKRDEEIVFVNTIIDLPNNNGAIK